LAIFLLTGHVSHPVSSSCRHTGSNNVYSISNAILNKCQREYIMLHIGTSSLPSVSRTPSIRSPHASVFLSLLMQFSVYNTTD